MIEFQDNVRPVARKLATSRDLKRCLDEAHPTGIVRRRAFVLEGLPKNFIQVLGARLKVPPDFFASHWAGPGSVTGNLLNRSPRHYNSQSRFILTLPKLHRARIKAIEGDDQYPFYFMESGVQRTLSRVTVFGDFDGPLSSFEQISYWSKCYSKSWDAILLVDPPLGNFVKWKNSSTPREVHRDDSIKLVDSKLEGLDQRGSWYPFYPSIDAINLKSTDWKNAIRSPSMESMFEDILLLYPLMERQSMADVTSCIEICRRIVLLAWTARLRVTEAQIIQEQCRMSVGNMAVDTNATNFFNKSWAQPWDPRDFGRLVRAKSALGMIDWEIYRNMNALGMYSPGEITEAWEAEAWNNLQHAVQSLKARLDIVLQAYMQAISVRESITSNKQAQQVGYLTSLATVFIPISFLAAIFSMGGNFAAGGSHFWVYWAIALPVVAVACCSLFTNFGRHIIGHMSVEISPV